VLAQPTFTARVMGLIGRSGVKEMGGEGRIDFGMLQDKTLCIVFVVF